MVTIDSGRKGEVWLWYITQEDDEVKILESIEDISSIDGRDVFFDGSIRGKTMYIAYSDRGTLDNINNLDKRIREKLEEDGISLNDTTGVVTPRKVPSKFISL